jgi:hypothetical protein
MCLFADSQMAALKNFNPDIFTDILNAINESMGKGLKNIQPQSNCNAL